MAKLPTRKENFSERYNELVKTAWLADHSAVRGCMVIKPYGYAIRENMQKVLDAMFKATGHKNAYFPLFIPKSFFSKEAKHVEWFATEAAIVTHYRLKRDEKTWKIEVDPDAKLEEELIVRPTSETIIWNTYRDWVKSYRDLPLLINQRANVVRWEMRTRLFLRTAEFLWQEGHTAHASAEEAHEEARLMHDVYDDFFQNIMAIAGVKWEKSESERFAWAEHTYTIEAMMQDGKALQSCTSHDLGQNFWKAFDVQFTNKNNELETAYATSRWLSTRAIGGLIMSHSDDTWLVLPPAVAPLHVVIVPFFKTEEDLEAIEEYLHATMEWLGGTTLSFATAILGEWAVPLTWKMDTDEDKSSGWKFNEYELQWVPVRISVGKREMEQWVVELYRRDTGEKKMVAVQDVAKDAEKMLYTIQKDLLAKNKQFRESNTVFVDTYEEFKQALDDGKFVMAHRDWTAETEAKIKAECQCVTRCIPFSSPEEQWVCVYSGKASSKRVLWARAY
jgi:prolyl-tRNA synthetase